MVGFCVSKSIRVVDVLSAADSSACVCMEGGGGSGIAGMVNSIGLLGEAINDG